jgi:hypothetical protein
MTETTIKTAVTTAATDALLNDAIGKKWYASRTFWVNIIAALALLAQIRYGFIIDSETQALVLTFVNLILRKITKEPIIL